MKLQIHTKKLESVSTFRSPEGQYLSKTLAQLVTEPQFKLDRRKFEDALRHVLVHSNDTERRLMKQGILGYMCKAYMEEFYEDMVHAGSDKESRVTYSAPMVKNGYNHLHMKAWDFPLDAFNSCWEIFVGTERSD